MKTSIVDINSFKLNEKLFVKSMQNFYPDMTSEIMLSTIKNNCFYCFAFDENDKAVSWCRVAKPWDKKTIYIIRQIETAEKSKGKGYASNCYQAVEKYLSQIDNAKKIIAFVDNKNVESIKFHEKSGYSKSLKTSKYLSNLYGWDSALMFEKVIHKGKERVKAENDNLYIK